MKQIFDTLIALSLFLSLQAYAKLASYTIYNQTINSIGGKEIKLSDYKGKPLLIVNIATQCGYTPQLEGLESLYQKYKSKGLVVLGIPSNDFGGQTPEANKDVKKFCRLNYGVNFPLTAKTTVIGSNKHSLIKSLVGQTEKKAEIRWNFEKFLVNKSGQVTSRFPSSVKPNDPKLISQLDRITAQSPRP